MNENLDFEYTFQEISDVLKISTNSCRQTLLVALKKLKNTNIDEIILGETMKEEIKKIQQYLACKYKGRNSLKAQEVANEMLMPINRVKELRKSGLLDSFSLRKIATFIVNNPAQKYNNGLK